MKKLLLLLPALLLFSGCGEKFDLSVFDSEKSSGNIAGDTVYVKLTPEWGGFNNPTDIIIGKDYFLYFSRYRQQPDCNVKPEW
jgi:hypothetical protein